MTFKNRFLAILVKFFVFLIIIHNKLIIILKLILSIFSQFSLTYNFLNKMLCYQNSFESFLQILISTCLSLCLSFSIVNFQQHITYFFIKICYLVHHSYLQKIFPFLPQYNQSLFFQSILVYSFILFSYVGLAAQLYFFLDLVSLLNIPTILIYRLLSKIYNKMIQAGSCVWKILTIDQERWLSCSYSKIFLRKSVKTIFIGSVIIYFYIVIGIIFYYMWLAFVMLILQIIVNIVSNIAILINNIASTILLFKQFKQPFIYNSQRFDQKTKKQFHSLKKRINSVILYIKQIKFVPLINAKKIIKIILGEDLFCQNIEKVDLQKKNEIRFQRVNQIFMQAIFGRYKIIKKQA